jgi:hypothetical protein
VNDDFTPIFDTDGSVIVDAKGGIYMGSDSLKRYRKLFGDAVGTVAAEFMATHEVMHQYEYQYGLVRNSVPWFEVATDILAAYYMANKYYGDVPRMYALVQLNSDFGDGDDPVRSTHGSPKSRMKAIAAAIKAYRGRTWGPGLQPFTKQTDSGDTGVSSVALDSAIKLAKQIEGE